MEVITYASMGYEGELVQVETDIRRGIPGFEIVGLPDGAVREARERVRVAIKNSGFNFPMDRILVNLAPADVKKEGSSFDLPVAVSLLAASGQLDCTLTEKREKVLVLGELQLSGRVRRVRGVLPAVTAGKAAGIPWSLVPAENSEEAAALGTDGVIGISNLREAASFLSSRSAGKARCSNRKSGSSRSCQEKYPDFTDIRGQPVLRRALEIAAAGMHNVFLFGPPGSGKTMAARRLPSILPALRDEEAIDVTKIYSIAGKLPPGCSLITSRKLRAPHHTASPEGIIGGGSVLKPGEISLAHKGVLLIDEAPEFGKSVLQSLREPLEEHRVSIARAGRVFWFPADCQLIMTANPCPCGNLGRDGGVCLCSNTEIYRYWKRMGSALLDRIDIRVPLQPLDPETVVSENGEASGDIRARVEEAARIQEIRYRSRKFSRNSRIPPGLLPEYCVLSETVKEQFIKAVSKLDLSSRACHSILKLSRTIADLERSDTIRKHHLLEAVQHRRYGESDFFFGRI